MRTIGIDTNEALIYEGDNSYLRGVWPSPAVMIATVLSPENGNDKIPTSEELGIAPLVFREDTFDAVSRIRRGRFYFRLESGQPQECCVQPHPALPNEAGIAHQLRNATRPLHLFFASTAKMKFSVCIVPTIVALGARDAYSLWRLVNVERIVTGEDLVTLKSRGAMGILPEIDTQAIPANERPMVTQALDALVQSAHTESPGSVIESARKAGQCCLGAWLSQRLADPDLVKKDLGELIRKLPEDATVIRAVAHVIGRFHVREKPNELVRLGLRPVVEGDSEFALTSIGLLLREFGWAQ